MLNQLKALIDISDNTKDALLTLLLDMAQADFAALTGSEDTVPEVLIVQMAVIKYNLLGSEGLTSQSINNINESFDAYEKLMPQIKRYRRAKFV